MPYVPLEDRKPTTTQTKIKQRIQVLTAYFQIAVHVTLGLSILRTAPSAQKSVSLPDRVALRAD